MYALRNKEIIKNNRINQGLSQEKLGYRIITMSLLSEIKSNRLDLGHDQLAILPDRLEIERNDFQDTYMNDMEEKLFSCYHSTVSQNPKEARKLFNYINEEYKIGLSFMHSDIKLLYLIIKLKFYLLVLDKRIITCLYEQIRDLPTSLNPIIEYIRKKTIGIYYFRMNNNKKSISALKEALVMTEQLNLTDEDKAELYYQIALTSERTSEVFESIQFAEKALSLYQGLYFYRRSAECHVILGLNHHKIQQFEKAESNYLSAKKIGVELQDVYLESMALHNIGCIQTFLGNSEEAIFYYLESLKLNKREDRSLYSICSLVREYYSLNQFEFAKGWAEEGLMLSQKTKVTEYVYHFTVLLYQLNHNSELADYVANIVIPYFRNAGRKDEIVRYAEMLANYYVEAGNYKLACQYFDICLQVQKEKMIPT